MLDEIARGSFGGNGSRRADGQSGRARFPQAPDPYRYNIWTWLAQRARARHRRCTWYVHHGPNAELRERLLAERVFRATQERECLKRVDEPPSAAMLTLWSRAKRGTWRDGYELELYLWPAMTRTAWYQNAKPRPSDGQGSEDIRECKRKVVQPRWSRKR